MIRPDGLTFQNWASQTANLLFQYGFFPKVLDEEKWHEWGNFACNVPALASVGAPATVGFKSWQDWARRFNDAGRLLVGTQ